MFLLDYIEPQMQNADIIPLAQMRHHVRGIMGVVAKLYKERKHKGMIPCLGHYRRTWVYVQLVDNDLNALPMPLVTGVGGEVEDQEAFSKGIDHRR
jgi:hypothetical protein